MDGHGGRIYLNLLCSCAAVRPLKHAEHGGSSWTVEDRSRHTRPTVMEQSCVLFGCFFRTKSSGLRIVPMLVSGPAAKLQPRRENGKPIPLLQLSCSAKPHNSREPLKLVRRPTWQGGQKASEHMESKGRVMHRQLRLKAPIRGHGHGGAAL